MEKILNKQIRHEIKNNKLIPNSELVVNYTSKLIPRHQLK